jgi:hypothetical protein
MAVSRGRKKAVRLTGDDYPVIQPALAELSPLDISQVSEISGIGIGALNVQFARDVYPWASTGQQGRARLFDPHFAMHLAITGCLMDLGVSVHTASASAVHIMMAKDLSQPGLKAVIGPGSAPHYRPVRVVQATTLAELEEALGIDKIKAFIVLDLNRLFQRFVEVAKFLRSTAEAEPGLPPDPRKSDLGDLPGRLTPEGIEAVPETATATEPKKARKTPRTLNRKE